MKSIETERLSIRPFIEDDFEEVAALLSDAEVMRFSLKGPLNREEAREYFEEKILNHYAQHGFGLCAVFHRTEGRFLGLVGLISQVLDEKVEVELAFRLIRSAWGQGFATEAAQAVATYAFQELGCDHLISIISPENVSSQRVVERLHMLPVKRTEFHGFTVDIYWMDKLHLVPFSSQWVHSFQEEEHCLKELFQPLPSHFFHIGSTAIVGCAAKPVIDILGVVAEISTVDVLNEVMKAAGYSPKGEFGMKRRRFFRKRGVHLHVFEESDPEVGRHLRFRDYLRAHPEKVKEYSQFKEQLARNFPCDRVQYVLGKEAWIKQIDREAAWAAQKQAELPVLGPRKNVWTEKEIIEAMEVNLHLEMTYFAKYLPTREVVFEPDVTVVRSRIPSDTFNCIIGARFNEKNANRRIRHILSLFEERNLPFTWWVGPGDTPENLGEFLIEEGLTKDDENIGMSLDLALFKPNKTGAVSVERVLTLKQLADFDRVHVLSGGHPDVFEQFFKKTPPILYQEGAPFEMFVGYVNGKAVTTGLLVFHAQVAGVYFLSTVPDERRKGYCSSLLHHMLSRAQDKGYFLATLQAALLGKGVYEKLGFTPCCTFVEYKSATALQRI